MAGYRIVRNVLKYANYPIRMCGTWQHITPERKMTPRSPLTGESGEGGGMKYEDGGVGECRWSGERELSKTPP